MGGAWLLCRIWLMEVVAVVVVVVGAAVDVGVFWRNEWWWEVVLVGWMLEGYHYLKNFQTLWYLMFV